MTSRFPPESFCVWGWGAGRKDDLCLSRNLPKRAWAFKGSPTVSKWDMVMNKQLLLTQLWVVRGVCFSLLLVTVNHF